MLRRKVIKGECERIHVKRRFKERFGIDLTRIKRRDIINMILSGRATFIEKESNRISLYDVNIEHQVIRVAYDRLRKELVTAMVPSIISLDEQDEASFVPNPVLSKDQDPFWDEYKKRMLNDNTVLGKKSTPQTKSVPPKAQNALDPFWEEYRKKMLSDKAVSSCKIVLQNNPVSSQIRNTLDPFWDEYKKKMLSGKTVLKT
jgi:hypothetical protein